MSSETKLKAAIAGVLYYMQMEEDYEVEPVVTRRYPTPWQLSGRTSIMQMRALVQRRVIKRR